MAGVAGVAGAAAVVFATAEACEEFRRLFPAVPAARLHVVENGFDEGDFRKAQTLLEFSSDQGSEYGDYYRGVLDLYGGLGRAAKTV